VEVSGHFYALALVVPGTKSELPIEKEMAGHHRWSGRFGEIVPLLLPAFEPK